MNLNPKFVKKIFALVVLLLTGCVKTPEVESTSSDSRYLYVAAGTCYSGNNTTFSNTTSSNLVYRVNTDSAQVDAVIADYFSSPANTGDSPSSIVNNDSESLFVLVENTSTTSLRRIERVEKRANGLRTTFSANVTAMNNRLRDIYKLPNGDITVSKSIAIEYFTASNARIGAPFINATAAPCNTSTTLISKVLPLTSGKYVFLHAAAGQNRFGIFATSGGTTCAAAQAAPTANAYPSAAFYDATNAKLIVAYSGNAVTTDLNSIYVYSIDETTNAITNAQKLYDASLYPTTKAKADKA